MSRLYGNQSRSHHQVPCIQHDPQRSLWCILPQCKQSKVKGRGVLFPRGHSTRYQTNQTQWSHLCTLHHTQASGSLSSRGRTGCTFLNAQEAKIMRLTLQELGHPQPPTPIHIDNSTCVGIVNNTQKRIRSRAMENKYFWLLDGDAQGQFKFHLHPGQENLGDYPSKAHTGAIQWHVWPFYLHTEISPRELPRAAPPRSRRGCAETLGDPYYDRIPLPRIPGYQKLDREIRISQSVNFANATQELTTQTSKLANIVNSFHDTRNVHGNYVTRSRYGTAFHNYATPTNLRYIHNPYCTLERQ